MKYIKTIFFLIILTLSFKAYSDLIPIENIFSDINSSYKYYKELVDLYDRQAIYPDSDWKFNPEKLLKRDEFISIAMEVSCRKCTKPSADLQFIDKYENKKLFFDLDNSNRYSYCIAYASENNFIKWYIKWDKCENWVSKDWEIPFCPENNINLEEAIAIILRDSNIFTIEDNNKVIEEINNWNIKDNLSDDVWVKNPDWSVYTFYWYLKKALNYKISEFDENWNEKIYKLLELNNWKINPKKYITKEEFLKMAYIALKTNSCKNTQNNNLATKFNIYDKKCWNYDENCEFAKLDSKEDTYDFKAFSSWACDKWINETNWYIWKFYNLNTNEQIIKYWKFLDNYKFNSDWIWEIHLTASDNCSKIWEIYNTTTIEKNINTKWLNVSLKTEPIIWTIPLNIKFESIVSWWKWDYKFLWDFWNWVTWNWKNSEQTYLNSWIYKTTLFAFDSEWNNWKASVLINVLNIKECENKDNDNDWINDCDDLCPLIKWDKQNSWCPIIKYCDKDCKCDKWEVCNTNLKPACFINWICVNDPNLVEKISITEKCLKEKWWKLIYWNVVCNSCPCENFIDFFANLRICDYLFPSINSQDNRNIFSAWPTYKYIINNK